MKIINTGLHYPINLPGLPQNWCVDYLGAFCDEIQPGFACGRHSEEEIGVQHLRPMNINRKGNIELSNLRFVEKGINKRRLMKNDVLFNNTNSPELIGKTAWIGDEAMGMAFSNHMTRLKFKKWVDSQFTALQLHFLWMTGYFFHGCVKHVNQASISSRDLSKKIPIIIPPLAEQHRIVAKIEELFSDLDAGIKSLETARAQLKIYRQTVLKYAFEGKLTRQWRSQHAHTLEPATELLKKIKEERDKANTNQLEEWKEKVTQWQTNGKEGRKPAKPMQPKELRPLTEEELKELSKLPAGWSWIKIGKIGTAKGGKRMPKGNTFSNTETPYFYIMAGNLKFGTITGKLKNITESTFRKLLNYRVIGDEVYVTIVGACIGDTGLIPETIRNAILTENAAKIVDLIRTNNKFLSLWISSSLCKLYINRKILSATLGKLALSRIENLPIPICSISEQHQIVSEIESRLSVCDKLEVAVEQSLKKAESLRQSILKKAFEGKLVPQDLNDEPAHFLLERIKKEKERLNETQSQIRTKIKRKKR